MFDEFRYIQVDEAGLVACYCAEPVFVDGVEITIDTEDITAPEMPTDAIYDLYYNETEKLHWVKVADFEPETPEESVANMVTREDMTLAIASGVNDV